MLLKGITISVCLSILMLQVNAQHRFTVEQAKTQSDSILSGNRDLPQMLILGSFHFAYYNLDAHKTGEDEQVDVLSVQRQKEMEELVAYISKYKPTKIAVESGPITGYLLRNYEEWIAGKRSLGRSETEQIGFRLMRQFGMDTIYGVDAIPLMYDLYDAKDSTVLRPILDSIYTDWDFRSDDSSSQLYTDWYNFDDQLALKMSLKDYFIYMNDDWVLDKGYGAYLTGDFKLGSFEGADALAMHWYSRNLRIFRNLQEIVTSPDDRILLIIGAGHAGILTHLFECSNEFELVKVGEIK